MFAGHVTDLAATYRAARCVFAPMVAGTGISIKTIEALALAKPFVGTSKAFRGMPMAVIEEGGLHAYDSPEEFANAIARVLSEEPAAGLRSRNIYEQLFSNEASFSARDRSLQIALQH
jgi:glycosyltransferase involved in cell wall biosynthesis